MNSMPEGGKLISQIHQLSGRIFSRILKDVGLYELNPAQGRIIYELWKNQDLSQSELCERTKLDKSTLALMLDRLEKNGQIERCPDPLDARRKIIKATKKNKILSEKYTNASIAMTDIFYAGFTASEIIKSEILFRRILANLEKAE